MSETKFHTHTEGTGIFVMSEWFRSIQWISQEMWKEGENAFPCPLYDFRALKLDTDENVP
jgi:hypothetical protein